jgi:hypothetical protein
VELLMNDELRARFPFVTTLEKAAATFRKEALALPPSAFVPRHHPAYKGKWSLFPLELGDAAADFESLDIVANRMACPGTVAVLDTLDGLVIAGFDRLAPDAELSDFDNQREDVVVRCEVALVLCEEEAETWPEGSVRLVDVRGARSVFNSGDQPRLVLIADVKMPFAVTREMLGLPPLPPEP